MPNTEAMRLLLGTGAELGDGDAPCGEAWLSPCFHLCLFKREILSGVRSLGKLASNIQESRVSASVTTTKLGRGLRPGGPNAARRACNVWPLLSEECLLYSDETSSRKLKNIEDKLANHWIVK